MRRQMALTDRPHLVRRDFDRISSNRMIYIIKRERVAKQIASSPTIPLEY